MNTTTNQLNGRRGLVRSNRKACAGLLKALLALSITLGWGSQASAVPINMGFEANFSGWTRVGNTSIQTASFGIAPNEGTKQALISNATDPFGDNALPPVDAAEVGDGDPMTLAYFLGENAAERAAIQDFLDDGYSTEGSAIKSASFYATAGQVISFYYNFLTTDPGVYAYLDDEGNTVYQYNEYNDFAFVILNAIGSPITSIVDALPLLSGTSLSFPNEGYDIYQTGYRRFDITIPADAIYQLGIGVVHAGSNSFSSALLVDVPEPSTGLLLVAGLVGLVWWRRSQVASV